MPRVPRRYSIHLILSGGQTEVVHFATIEAFQQWYQGVLHGAATPDAFVNVPISGIATPNTSMRSIVRFMVRYLR